jgi:L-rhamnose-H+ transport protein
MLRGLLITLLAGAIGGSVLLPLKFMKRWPFQNSWAVYSLWAYFIMPWVIAFLTIPRLLSIYSEVSFRTALICAGCGLGWGVAVVLFGLAVNLVGLSLASAIIYGASVAIGSLAPLVISQPERLESSQGLLIIAANAFIIVGILLCTLAGKKRDNAENTPPSGITAEESTRQRQSTFVKGLVAAILAAILSSLFNIALAYGGEFSELAVARGAKAINSANAQWAFTVSFGYLPNLIVSLTRLTNSRTWNAYQTPGTLTHWIWPPLMGLMWIGGTALYGSGATVLGRLGPVIGWPIFMSTMITIGNFWGWLTGEWKEAPRRALQLLVIGIIVQVFAICLLSWANR